MDIVQVTREYTSNQIDEMHHLDRSKTGSEKVFIWGQRNPQIVTFSPHVENHEKVPTPLVPLDMFKPLWDTLYFGKTDKTFYLSFCRKNFYKKRHLETFVCLLSPGLMKFFPPTVYRAVNVLFVENLMTLKTVIFMP